MADIFIAPGKIISGSRALEMSISTVAKLGKKALVVTDTTMEKLGNLKKVTAMLEQAKVSYVVYTAISGEPHDGMIINGVEIYNRENCDFLVALGGGSPIDSMKAIAMLVSCGGKPIDYMGKIVSSKLAPMVAIPTTAGTGSEATQFTIITDRASQVKMLLKGPALIPNVAVIDPQFTITAPPKITAATGIDALCHAVEAYTSKQAQPLSDIFALSACQKIFKNLRTAWRQGDNEESRIQMSLAALEAGMAFNNSSVTIVHGMSRPIGALFHVPHGISNAMLLHICLEYIADGAPERFAAIAVACGFADGSEPVSDAAEKLLEQVKALLDDIEIPTLEDCGINREVFMKMIPKMASDAYVSGSPSNTRKKITVEIMEELYQKLWEK
ncbi:MAG: iron-containing alcohol dehydrogenase [Enterocloster sp.]